ncbi:MAG: VacJ family lipoprotein [Alphaproteobacteria bacterium]|nr:VacJ family lipoprotein [Alphaproteobacteria bacterium]
MMSAFCMMAGSNLCGIAQAQTVPPDLATVTAQPYLSETPLPPTQMSPPVTGNVPTSGNAAPDLPATAQTAPPADGATPVSPTAASSAPPGEIIVTADPAIRKQDPFQAVNIQSFKVTQTVANAVVEPVADSYRKHVPGAVRDGVHNFFRNLHEPVVFVNFLLQHKFGRAFKTVARFGINSTLGIAGAFDIAKRRPFHLCYDPNGLADTLGFYGVKPGPFFFLPLFGPTTVRDAFGGVADSLMVPTVVGAPFNKPYYTIPTAVLRALDHDVRLDEALEKRNRRDDYSYAYMRRFYLQRRQAEIDALHIRHGKWSAARCTETL